MKKIKNIAAQLLGSAGGKARVRNSTLEQRRAWGQLGGRPKLVKAVEPERCPECNAVPAIQTHALTCPFTSKPVCPECGVLWSSPGFAHKPDCAFYVSACIHCGADTAVNEHDPDCPFFLPF